MRRHHRLLLLMMILIESYAAQQFKCKAKKSCKKLGGICQPKDIECRGTPYEGKMYCKGYTSCLCCAPPKGCYAMKRCTKKNGKCIPTSTTCEGKVIPKACKQKDCQCCVAKLVFTTTLCESMNGTCQSLESECSKMKINNCYNSNLSEIYCDVPNGLSACCAKSGQVFIADIENSLSYCLRNNVLFNGSSPKPCSSPNTRKLRDPSTFMKGPSKALYEFLGIIVKYLNTPQHLQGHTYGFIKDIHAIINVITPASLTPTVLLNNLNNVQKIKNKNFISPIFQPSVSCHKMGNPISCYPSFWMYTCGLWNIFHTLTHAFLVTSTTTAVDIRNFLHVIHDFVIHFQGCGDCEYHFRMAYDQTVIKFHERVETKQDAILWLWCMHNSVNQRTTSQITVPPHPQFPVHAECSNCWSSKPADGSTITNCKKLFCGANAEAPGTCFRVKANKKLHFPVDAPMHYPNFDRNNVLQYLKSVYDVPYSHLNAYNPLKPPPLGLVPHKYCVACPKQD